MPKNVAVQVLIAALLGAVFIALTINLVQFNAVERDLIETRRQVEANAQVLTEIKDQLERGVVQQPGTASPRGAQADPELTAALADPANLLKADPVPEVAPNATASGTLNLPKGSDSKGYNLIVENGADVNEMYRGFIGNRLARRHVNDPNTWAPDLAIKVVSENDGKTFRVTLRKGVLWHKPAVDLSDPRYAWLNKDHEVTTADVAFMMRMLRDPQVKGAAPMQSYFKFFDRVEVVGPYEMLFHWKRPYALALPTTLDLVYPLPEWLYAYDEDGNRYSDAVLGLKINAHWYNDRAIGTGPYRFVESKPGEYVKLTRNDAYFGPLPAFKDVTYHVLKDPDLRLLKFQKGELDVAFLRPAQYKRLVVDDPQSGFNSGAYKHEVYTALAYYYIGWNGDGPLFRDKRVRLAMTHAFNREAIVKRVFQGLGEVTSGPFHSSTPWYDTSIKPHPFDLDKARKLLDAAGWVDSDGNGVRDKRVAGERRELDFALLVYAGRSEFKTMADIFKEDLLDIGVKMSIVNADWPNMQKRMEDRNFDAFTGGWGLFWENDPFQLWHSSQADLPKGSNRVGFRNAEADKLIEEARGTMDFDKQRALFHRFHAIVHEEQPYTFFYIPKSVIAWQPELENVTFQKVRPQVLYRMAYRRPAQ